jgi:ABC-type multidrug transport system fused ATPase/permease subunit
MLFNETLLANIRFGKPEATMEEVIEAARQANAYDFIMRMRDKFDTLLGDRGIRLSGGQAQRIALARAMLIDPQILLLDEATSALDTQSERLVQNAIDNVSRNRTVVVVAHRLSTIKHADKIIVLEEGRLVEEGTHEELMENKSYYWKYVQMQDLNVREKSDQADGGVTLQIDELEEQPKSDVPGFPEYI